MGQINQQVTAPAHGGFSITPNDSTALTKPTRGLYVGGAGNINVTFVDGTTLVITGVLAGVLYPFELTHVLATSTTATNLVGLY